MDFGLLPPEVNSGLMYAGPGSGPLLAAAAAWDAVAAELESAGAGYSSSVSELAGLSWFGPSSLAMSGAAAPYAAWLQAAGAQAAQTATQAYAAAAAYEVAFAMTVPPPVIAANRALLMALIATNFFGQNTAAIAATEAEYTQMWVQDAAAMYAYAADSASASTLESFDEPPQTTNPNGQTEQANTVGKTTADTTTARTQSLVQQLSSTAGSDPAVSPGTTVNVSPGGATISPGVTVTVSPGYPVTVTGGVGGLTVTDMTFMYNGMPVATVPAGTAGWFTSGAQILSGTIDVLPPFFGYGPGIITVPGGGITAGSGVTVTLNAGGLVTAVNTGTIVTAPALVPVVPVAPSASGALAAAPAAAASPGLAGTAGIQPQLNVDALVDALSAG